MFDICIQRVIWHSEKGVETFPDFAHNQIKFSLYRIERPRAVELCACVVSIFFFEALLKMFCIKSFEGSVECSSIQYHFYQLLRESMGYAPGNLSPSFPDFLPPESQQDAHIYI